jgi:uracil-DNA glycosylase
MDIPVWEQREVSRSGELDSDRNTTLSSDILAGDAAESPLGASADDSWLALQAEVSACTLCPLHSARTNTVFGVGGRPAKIMFIGEAPGEREDQRGEPFVGPAGQLLNAMLHAIGLARDDVFIANILKCRPPRNRDPSTHETATCTPYLTRQIALLKPQLLVALGRVAAQHLLHTSTPIGRLRGQVHAYGALELPLLVTYHPAYLLRSPAEKRHAWKDLKMMREWLRASSLTHANGG